MERAISDYRRACELANGWSRPCEAASALERARRDVGGLLKRVRRLVGEGEPDRALDLLDRAISRVPDRASLKYWRIRILMRENRVEQARRALSKLPPAMLDRPAAMKLRSSIEMRRENWAAALESLNLYLERRPAEPRALHRRGRCREQLGRWETARSDYRRACSLASGWMEPCRAEDRLQRAIWEVDRLVRRSRRQARAGRGRRARQLADRAYSRRPKGDEVALWHLELTMEQQRWGEVRSAVEHLPNSARDAPLGFLARARLSERDGNVERARGLYSRYLGARPDDADARYRRGLLRNRAGDIDGAAADFVRACRVEPGHVRACRAARGGVAPGAVRAPTFRADIRSGVELTGETFTGYSTAVGLSGWIERATRLELDFEWRDRSVEGREATDGRVDVGGMQLLDNGVRFAGGGGAALEPDFAPHWHAYLQGGYRFSRQFAADLRYWRIQFQPIGEHVVSPRANFTAGRFELRWRHFVSFTDLGEVHVASLLETGVDVAGPTRWHFGLGAGDGRDYLELRRSADDGHILIRAGFRHDLASKHRLGLDLTHRRDELGKPEFPRTRFQLVYEFVRR
ncbi:MAG: tetratricopeptide repeat protein [Bradymonadaceae bacterium]